MSNEEIFTEKEILMNNIKIISKQIKESELNKDFNLARNSIDNMILLIKNFIEKNVNEDNKMFLNTLIKSYEEKKSTYEYFDYINQKTSLIKQKMTEKYLGKRNKPIENNPQVSPNTQSEEYEFVPSSSSTCLIKEIIDICDSLIKYYEIQVESIENRGRKLTPVNAYESFFIYDYQNTTINNNFHLTDKYIEEIKSIKRECEKILDTNYDNDVNAIKKYEKEISIIKEEFGKLYPKYQNLKQILEKNNLVTKKNLLTK